MAQGKKEYELLSPVDFGLARDKEGRILPDEDQPEASGVVEGGKKLTLPVALGNQLCEVGSARLAGEGPDPGLAHDNPEELGYEGEKAQEAPKKSKKASS